MAVGELIRPARRTIRWLGIVVASAMACAATAMLSMVALAEWAVASRAAPAASIPTATVVQAVAVPSAVIALFLVATPVVLVFSNRVFLDPLVELAGCARQIASGDRLQLPGTERGDQVGDLARALRDWEDAAVLRQVLLSSAPVGIIWLDGRIVGEANPAALATLGYRRDEFEGGDILEFIHPDNRYVAHLTPDAMAAAGVDRVTVETRLRRRDGSWLWCSAVVAPVSLPGDEAGSFVVILEDISERKRQAERAAAVQREMLPSGMPELEGYELAGSFLPAQEVAGDLYDWVERGDGHLDLTVADVMGKGMGAALVMAALRTALRTAPGELGPAARVARAGEAVTFGSHGDGLFVTLFHASLEMATGRLRYVDAGHGYCVVRRAGGRVERLAVRSMPLGMGIGERFAEGEIQLEPGDMLLVCSDGLMEVGEVTVRLDDVAGQVRDGDDAAAVVSRLVSRASGRLTDDATAVVLYRLGDTAPSRMRRAESPSEPFPLPDPDGAGAAIAAPGPEPVVPQPAGVGAEAAGNGFLRFATDPSTGLPVAALAALGGLVALVEWRLRTGVAGSAGGDPGATLLAVIVPVLVGAPWVVLIAAMGAWIAGFAHIPVPVLVRTARRIAAGEWVSIPYGDRDDEIGDLARALRRWRDAAAIREVLVRSAPVGIFRVDRVGRMRDSNPAVSATLGYEPDELEGMDPLGLIHPDDQHLVGQVSEALTPLDSPALTVEVRLRRRDGRWLWCSTVVAPVSLPGQEAGSFVVILEDISERKRQAEWAAAVQREMLPSGVPELEGYELAGSFLPTQEVAGDLYDWVERGDGHLDLTVADVMGKGMGAALVMAALRTALRTAPGELGPAARVARAGEAMTFGSEGDGLFVTLFHASLEMATGRLRYVDAGHGYCAIRRAGGAVERLEARSLPLGVGLGEAFREGEVRLEPGDLLLVCSDGLMEVGEETARLEEVLAALDGGDDATAVVERLVARVGTRLSDAATVLALRRLAPARAASAAST